MRDCFTSNASSTFQLGHTAVWPIVNFPCMTHRLNFHPPPLPLPISKLPQRQKCREGEVTMFLPRWILHTPRIKSINGDGESLESALAKLPVCTGLDCRAMGQVLLLLAVTLPMLNHNIFWPLLTFWQLQKEAMTGVNAWISGTALKEFACFAFHTANQINSSLSLTIYINMSFVYIPWKNVPQVRKGPCLGSLVSKSGNESAVLKLHGQTNRALQQNMARDSSSACLSCKNHHETRLLSKNNPWVFQ